MWKAGRYLGLSTKFATIPDLKDQDTTVESNVEKADLLMNSFFPPQPAAEIVRGGTRIRKPQFPFPGITLQEVERAIFQSKPKKAPGTDRLPFLVWQQLWDTVKHHIFRIYDASLRLGHVPRAWKIAKIVVLRKPNKLDYSKPNAYRPISLLPTISKWLEALVATRISYLAETEGLLPQNHFGARKQRPSEQALNILVERIHDAWRSNKVLSLVTFDVQGAYNGVDIRALSIRLWERRIPQLLINWVESFCAERRAHITFDGFSSDTAQIAQAGLPQGSPLSPALYLFYNANLVASPINYISGSIAFVDDYSAWVIGPNASANTLKLQETVILGRWHGPKKVERHSRQRRQSLFTSQGLSVWIRNHKYPSESGNS